MIKRYPSGGVVYDRVSAWQAALLAARDPGMSASLLPARAVLDGAKSVTITPTKKAPVKEN